MQRYKNFAFAALVAFGAIAGTAQASTVTGNPAPDPGWTEFGNSMANGTYVIGSANYSYRTFSAGLTIQAGSNLEIADGALSWLPGDTVLGVGGEFESVTAADAGWTAFTGTAVNSLFGSAGPKLQVKFGTSSATWTTSTTAPGSGNGSSGSSAGGGRVQVRTSGYFQAGTPTVGQTEPWTWDGNSGQLLVLDKEDHIQWAGGTPDKRVARMIWIWDASTSRVKSWQLLLNVSLLSRQYPGFGGLLPGIGDKAVLTVQNGDGAFTDALVNIVQVPAVPAFSCQGFMPPLDRPVVVKKAGRVLPLRMNLLDSTGAIMSAITPPIVQVSYAGSYEYEEGALEELNFAGQGSDGNWFVWTGEYWAFNMVTKGLAPGTYTITAVSGADGEYVIDPSCSVTVQIE